MVHLLCNARSYCSRRGPSAGGEEVHGVLGDISTVGCHTLEDAHVSFHHLVRDRTQMLNLQKLLTFHLYY